jgi:hypothetical protein
MQNIVTLPWWRHCADISTLKNRGAAHEKPLQREGCELVASTMLRSPI